MVQWAEVYEMYEVFLSWNYRATLDLAGLTDEEVKCWGRDPSANLHAHSKR